LTQQV